MEKGRVVNKGCFLTALAVVSMESVRTVALSWCDASSVVEAVWVAECGLAVFSHVAFLAVADFLLGAPASVGALGVALGVGTSTDGAFLPEAETEGCAREGLSPTRFYQEAHCERGDP
jgi:hypothetical protein